MWPSTFPHRWVLILMTHWPKGRWKGGYGDRSLRDFEEAFEGIPLDRIGAALTINAVASILLAMFQVTAEKLGYSKDRVSATPQNDILKEMIGRGAWIFPVKPAIRLIGDTIEYSMKSSPGRIPSVSVDITSVSRVARLPKKLPMPFKLPIPTSKRFCSGVTPSTILSEASAST